MYEQAATALPGYAGGSASSNVTAAPREPTVTDTLGHLQAQLTQKQEQIDGIVKVLEETRGEIRFLRGRLGI
jgi:hypothetical protein